TGEQLGASAAVDLTSAPARAAAVNGAAATNGTAVTNGGPAMNGAAVAAGDGAGDGDAVLAVSDVSSGYGELIVIDDIGLTLRPGSITALLGANGAGKSTLCAALAGGLPSAHGSILLAGE